MQNDDGGWAAFDKNNDKIFLNDIPFSDMSSLSDPSTPDIAGRVLEALGLLDDPRYRTVCARGIAYLRRRKSRRAAGSAAGASITSMERRMCSARCRASASPRRPDGRARPGVAALGAERRRRLG